MPLVNAISTNRNHVFKFGRNGDVGTSQEEVIWDGSGDYTGFLATEKILSATFEIDLFDLR